MKIKVSYNGDIRLFAAEGARATFESVSSFVRENFTPLSFSLKYADDEDEMITVTTPAEFDEAVRLAEAEDRKSLKLTVHLLPLGAAGATPRAADAETEGKQGCRAEVRSLFHEFIEDPKVLEVIPDAAQVALSLLSEEAAANDGRVNVMDVLEKLFATFPTIREHAFIQKVYPKLPKLAEKVQPYLPMLLGLGADGIANMVPKMMQMAAGFGGGTNDCPWMGRHGMAGSSPMGPMGMFAPFVQQMFAAAGGEDVDGDDEDDDDEDIAMKDGDAPDGKRSKGCARKDVVHRRVACDGCGVMPIVGVRFKCVECPDFDLCAKCEAEPNASRFERGTHSVKHVMVKYRKQAKRNGPFGAGAFPFFGGRGRGHRFGPHGGRFGGYHHGQHGHHGHRGHRFGHRGAHGGGTHGFWNQGGRWDCPRPSRNERPSAVFVADVSLPEGVVVPPSAKLTKTWSVRNDGSVAWPAGTVIVHHNGSRFGPFEAEIGVSPAPGETVNVSIPIETPSAPGHYAAKYRLKMPRDVPPPRRKFGKPLLCRFVVSEDVVVNDDADANASSKADVKDDTAMDTADTEAPPQQAAAKEPEQAAEPEQVAGDEDTALAEAVQASMEDFPAPDAKVAETEPAQPQPEDALRPQLDLLAAMGFVHEDLNRFLLTENDCNVQKTALKLVQLQNHELFPK